MIETCWAPHLVLCVPHRPVYLRAGLSVPACAQLFRGDFAVRETRGSGVGCYGWSDLGVLWSVAMWSWGLGWLDESEG